MKKNNKKIIITFNVLLLILLTIITWNTKTIFIEKIIKDGYSLIIKTVSIPINYFKEELDKINYKGNLYEENIKLKEEINELNFLVIENSQLRSDIDILKNTLQINTLLSEYNKINATVIDRNLGYWFDNITIDKGSQNGIKENQVVISNNQLIGYIEKTNFLTSTVKLITSNLKNKISIKIKKNDIFIYGIITGYKDGFFLVEGINDIVDIDSIVTTAGLGNGYPEGIYVGKVTELIKDNFGISSIVKVKANIDFNLINVVSVLGVKE